MDKYILAIDQGTTSSRALIFNKDGNVISSAQQEFTQYYPNPGEVEHDPLEIWQSVLSVVEKAIEQGNIEKKTNRGYWHHQSTRNNGCVE